MSARIDEALAKLFDQHRIVFWYDAKQELHSDFEAVALPDIEKIELANNEYSVKYRILRQEPEQKFLLYNDGAQPPDLENWLLDVQLAQGVFHGDQTALWLAELDLGNEFTSVVENHTEFFRSTKRQESLKRLLRSDDSHPTIRLKMLSVCTGSDPELGSVLEHLFQELADNREDKIRLIHRCGLKSFLWDQLTRLYGYDSQEPGIRDFVLTLFKSCYDMDTGKKGCLTGDGLVLLKRWKDSRRFEQGFEKLSHECAGVLGIEQDLEERDFRDVLELDYFRLIDLKILSSLVHVVEQRTASHADLAAWIRQRRQTHWFSEFHHLYEAVESASHFLHALEEANLTMESLADGINRYATSWFRLDQFYRKFIHHCRQSGQTSLLSTLIETIENHYVTNYLLKLCNSWQPLVDQTPAWEAFPIPSQQRFFEKWVRPFLNKDKKICVIISDAMRYEIGEELLGRIRQEDRYSADIHPSLSTLPSYTQLGMAALLPNKELTIADDTTSTVLVDSKTSRGLAGRNAILDQATPKRTKAMKAEDVLSLVKDDCRLLVRDHDLLYIYHNRIDATGDKRDTEEQVFEAVDQTLEELLRLIKKLVAANVNNLLVTADHGFIYQHRSIEESDFSGGDVQGETILFRDRRFVLGKNLEPNPGMTLFSSSQLGLEGDVQVQIPKGINRLRLRGSGSRFVHGGATLQETVIPVLSINKKRQSDTSVVDVEIVGSSGTTITTGQLGVVFYQVQPVTDKMRPRELRAGLYAASGELISDSHDLLFDFASDNPRDREVQTRFILTSNAKDFEGQEVILRLEEKHAGTSHYKKYKSQRYLMRRSFITDFEL